MSTSRSSPEAGPSLSPSPEPVPSSSYRIERFDSTLATELMVTSRSKRATAGNRLKALLDQELEKDEVFAEVENDIDFEANENEDGVDIVDSDFDRDSDDDARAGEDESEGEREIQAQEKADKQKRRAAARAIGITKRPPAPSIPQRATRRPATTASTPEETPAKRRRISFAPDQPSSSSSSAVGTPGDSARRTSARAATVQSKRQVESRLEEASQRRAAQPAKTVVKKKASLTQDALIAEALEVEEENRESLRRFLEQEEERRAKQRQRKERITGPFVRWMSVGLKTKVVEEIATADKTDGKSEVVTQSSETQEKLKTIAQVENSDGQNGVASKQLDGSSEVCSTQQSVLDAAPAPGEEHALRSLGNDPVIPKTVEASVMSPAQSQEQCEPDTKLSSSSDGDFPTIEATINTPSEEHNSSPSKPLPSSESVTETALDKPNDQPSAPPPKPTSSPPPTPATNTSLTLDPVIAARHQSTLLRSTTTKPPAPTTTTASSTTSHFELQARTLLSVERIPQDWEWLDEFSALLGDHCAWDAYPFVPSRNRPLKPRQSICPITGLPAIYKDPRTGIPFANAYAYGIITRLLHNRFRWTGGHYESRAHDGKEKGKRREREDKFVGGKVGAGAVPPEMGIYIDDEQETGANCVWNTARDVVNSKPSQEQTRRNKPTKGTVSTTISETPNSIAEEKEMEREKERKKSKPGFDVVLTNAIAPGDEKAVLAAALSLPAGSTRSGRRVHRP